MRAFFGWLVRSPIRLVEACFGVLLLTAALTFGRGGTTPSVFLYFFGALLLFLTLYAYLNQGGPGR